MEQGDNDKKIKFSNSQREETIKSDKKLIETSKIKILENNEKYEESPHRWYNLVSYCLILFANGFQWLTFSTISKNFSVYYKISLWKVKFFSVIYFIIYPFLCIPEGWFLEKYLIKKGLMISSVTTLIGSFFKIFVNNDKTLTVCYLGQILPALFRPILLNSPGKIASNWFKEEKRTLICSICCLCDTFGILVGYLFNLAFIREKDTKNRDDFREKVFRYMLSEFIIVIFFCMPVFFIEKDKPDNPSSPSENKNKFELIKDLKELFTNLKFIFLLISSFFIIGYYFIILNIFNDLLDIYQIDKNQCTIIYSVSVIVGIISSLIFSFLMDKYKKFKLFLNIFCISAIVFQVFLTFLLELVESRGLNAFAICLIFYILINASIIPFYTIGMNYVCEITYPVSESISGGIIMTIAQICGICGTYLFDHFINHNEDKTWIINVILLIFFVFSFVFTLLLDDKLLRYKIDKAGIKEENSQIEDKKNIAEIVEIKQK